MGANDDLKKLKILLSEEKRDTDEGIKYIKSLIEKKQKKINPPKIYKIMKNSLINNKRFTAIYENKDNLDSIKLFDMRFAKYNRRICKIIYNNKLFSMTEKFNFSDKKRNIIKIELLIFNDIINLKGMFFKCNSLIKFYDSSYKEIIKENSYNFESQEKSSSIMPNKNTMINTYNLFKNHLIKSYSRLNNLIISDMSCLFGHCTSLILLPDLSKWNTYKVKNMTAIFGNCSSLISLPDISNWNLSNVDDISFMFFKCSSLKKLPDISKWDVHNVERCRYMFAHCSSLLILPNIRGWNLKKAQNDFVTMTVGLKFLDIYVKNGIALKPYKKFIFKIVFDKIQNEKISLKLKNIFKNRLIIIHKNKII